MRTWVDWEQVLAQDTARDHSVCVLTFFCTYSASASVLSALLSTCTACKLTVLSDTTFVAFLFQPNLVALVKQAVVLLLCYTLVLYYYY